VPSTSESSLIATVGLQLYFPVARRMPFGGENNWVKAVDGVSFAIGEGETYSLVGETGCGKTTTARMLLLVARPTAGDILFRGKSVQKFSASEKRAYRSSVQAVFQDPWSSLNPRMRVDDIVAEPLQATKRVGDREIRTKAAELLEQVGLPASAGRRFPHEFSGGQRQRIAIARALSPDPRLIVLDEPVSSLDVSIRAQIMNLLKDLQQRFGVSYLLIAHDLATVRFMSHKVGVMYLGKIVEQASARSIFTDPLHPYTKALLAASLPSRPEQERPSIVLAGEVPSAVNVPLGCAFHPRCPFVMPRCATDTPELLEEAPGHKVACHLY
jgi:oligopeptide/dipeptide ABC transporter ATP-binding protein